MARDVFTSTGSHTWNRPSYVDFVEVLVVAGGGGGGGSAGGSAAGGGGGAGGVVFDNSYQVSGNVNLFVGGGGAAGSTDSDDDGNDGDNSTFGSITAVGGGGGGARQSDGHNGGSGGGGGAHNTSGGSGSQGRDGGYSTDDPGGDDPAGGGGGYSEQGGVVSANGAGGDGGDGYDASGTFGTSYGENGWFAGGGAGGHGGGGGSDPVGGTGGGADMGNSGQSATGGGGSGQECSGGATPGSGGSGIVIVQYPDVAPPSTPQNLTSSVSNDDATLNWDPVNWNGDVGHYDVFRDGSYIGQSNNETFTDSNLSPGSYTYRVRAANSAGVSSKSNSTTASVVLTPSTPQNLSATPDGNDPDLSWDPVNWNGDQGHYEVLRGPVGGSLSQIDTVSSGSTTYNDTSATQENEYDYAVRAQNSAGTSGTSNRDSAVTIPADPSNLSGGWNP